MLKNAKPVLLGAAFAAAAWSSATAADLYEPPVYETPPPVYETPAVEYGGWYIRGDIDYHWSGSAVPTTSPMDRRPDRTASTSAISAVRSRWAPVSATRSPNISVPT